MPNWCDNSMTITATDKAEMDDFMQKITVTGETGRNALIFSTLLPMPEVLKDTTSPTPYSPDPNPNWANLLANGEITQEWFDHLCQNQKDSYEQAQAAREATGYTNWYDWQAENWGVKWGDIDTDADRWSDTQCTITFNTPWGPPVEGIQNISKMYPSMTFNVEWDEESGDRGEFTIAQGRILSQKEEFVPFDPEG